MKKTILFFGLLMLGSLLFSGQKAEADAWVKVTATITSITVPERSAALNINPTTQYGLYGNAVEFVIMNGATVVSQANNYFYVPAGKSNSNCASQYLSAGAADSCVATATFKRVTGNIYNAKIKINGNPFSGYKLCTYDCNVVNNPGTLYGVNLYAYGSLNNYAYCNTALCNRTITSSFNDYASIGTSPTIYFDFGVI